MIKTFIRSRILRLHDKQLDSKFCTLFILFVGIRSSYLWNTPSSIPTTLVIHPSRTLAIMRVIRYFPIKPCSKKPSISIRTMSSASSPAQPITSPFAPRHFLSIADLTTAELTKLVQNARAHKVSIKSGVVPENLQGALHGQTIAMMFNKRSTRTRVSSEAAITRLGGHPMFLGKDDIQFGVNESLYDTSVVISSMVQCMVARVGAHSDIENLAKHSTVPVINALSNDYHPLQIIADFLTISETFPQNATSTSLGVEGKKIAWIGDSNNVLFDLAIASLKLGVDISIASPADFKIPDAMRATILASTEGVEKPGRLTETTTPEEAIRDADILVTDTWISMGQEDESQRRIKAFSGYQITNELAKKGEAKEGWRFMHCLPRHAEEVDDDVFYGERSLVFSEAENRLWAMIAALEAFVVNKGKIL